MPRPLREDSPEDIQKCLCCSRPKCNNCLENKDYFEGYATTNTKPSSRGRIGKPVMAFGSKDKDKEDMSFKSTRDAARSLYVSVAAIQYAIRNGARCQGYYWRYIE